jgi:hypothetical protein
MSIKLLLKELDINPSDYWGWKRKKRSRHVLETMDSLNDPMMYLKKAFITELEHGRVGSKYGTNVTNDDVIATWKIVKAHLMGVEYDEDERDWKRFISYYDYLWWMEKQKR